MRRRNEIIYRQILAYCSMMKFAPPNQAQRQFKLFVSANCRRHTGITYSFYTAFRQKQSPCSTSASLLSTFWARQSWETLPSSKEWTVNGQIGGQCRGAWLSFGTRKKSRLPRPGLAVLTSLIMDFRWKPFFYKLVLEKIKSFV